MEIMRFCGVRFVRVALVGFVLVVFAGVVGVDGAIARVEMEIEMEGDPLDGGDSSGGGGSSNQEPITGQVIGMNDNGAWKLEIQGKNLDWPFDMEPLFVGGMLVMIVN